LLLSFAKSIGFHWVFSFTTIAYLGLWLILDQKQIIASIKFCIGFNYAQLLIILFALMLPVQTWMQLGWQGNHYASLVSNIKHQDIRNYLNPYNTNFIFATHSFSDATIMAYDSKLPAYVFGYGSEHGRQGDFEEDFKTLDNKNILIYSDNMLKIQDYSAYFEHIELKSFDLYGAKFYYILGYHFKYPVYREKVLRIIKDYFWHVPNFLPHASNFYCQKYFDQKICNI
jgi:hypothetical protein